VLDFESVLQEDEIALTVFVGHFCFEGRAEGVEGGISGCDCFGGEETDPAEAFEDAVFFVGVFEGGFGGDGQCQILFGGRAGFEDLCRCALPGHRIRGGGEEVMRVCERKPMSTSARMNSGKPA